MRTLYKLTFKSGKSYIGQTVRKMHTRFTQHRAAANRGSMLPVHCAWRTHGDPELQIVGTFDTDEDLHKAEIDAISSHNTLAPNGYNLGHGGETAPSKNPEVAKKISARAKGRKHSDTSVWSDAVKARWEDGESREKMLEGMKSSWDDEDRRKAASDRIKAMWAKRREEGWSMPESTKLKLANKKVSDEARAKMSASAKGRKKAPRSEETRAKISENTSAAWRDPEARKARGDAIKTALLARYANMTDEEKLAFSETRKRAWETRKLKQTQSD